MESKGEIIITRSRHASTTIPSSSSSTQQSQNDNNDRNRTHNNNNNDNNIVIVRRNQAGTSSRMTESSSTSSNVNFSSSNGIYISNLHPSINDSTTLQRIFEKYGTITKSFIGTHKVTQAPLGYAIIYFETPSSVNAAIAETTDVLIHGQEIKVSKYLPRGERALTKPYWNLYFKNFKHDFDTEQQVRCEFEPFGPIRSFKVEKFDGAGGGGKESWKGYGFICFEEADDAQAAIGELHDKLLPSGARFYVTKHESKIKRNRILRAAFLNNLHQMKAGEVSVSSSATSSSNRQQDASATTKPEPGPSSRFYSKDELTSKRKKSQSDSETEPKPTNKFHSPGTNPTLAVSSSSKSFKSSLASPTTTAAKTMKANPFMNHPFETPPLTPAAEPASSTTTTRESPDTRRVSSTTGNFYAHQRRSPPTLSSSFNNKKNLYIKNFKHVIETDSDLFHLFKKFGRIISAKLMLNENGSSKGYGFVSFMSPASASNAVQAMNGFTLKNGKQLYVGLAQSKVARQEELKSLFKQEIGAEAERNVNKRKRKSQNQLTVSSSSKQHDEKLLLCSICYNEFPPSESVLLDCHHYNCKACLKDWFNYLIRAKQVDPITCPNDGCEHKIGANLVKALVDRETFEKYDLILLDNQLASMDDIVFCPKPDCQCPTNIDLTTSPTSGTCPKCNYNFCTNCEQEYHGLTPCDEFLNDFEEDSILSKYHTGSEEEKAGLRQRYGADRLDKALPEYLTKQCIQKLCKSCPNTNCNVKIEKINGCNHMICVKCTTHFCWLCTTILDKSDPYAHFRMTDTGTPGTCLLITREEE